MKGVHVLTPLDLCSVADCTCQAMAAYDHHRFCSWHWDRLAVGLKGRPFRFLLLPGDGAAGHVCAP